MVPTTYGVTYGTMGAKEKNRNHGRLGTQSVIEYPSTRNPAQSLQECAIYQGLHFSLDEALGYHFL